MTVRSYVHRVKQEALQRETVQRRKAEGSAQTLERARSNQPDLTYEQAWDALIGLQQDRECCQPSPYGGGTDAEQQAFAEAVIAAILEEHHV